MSAKPIVLVAEQIAENGIEVLRASCEIITPWKQGRPYNAEEIDAADGIIIRLAKVTAAVMDSGRKLKVIGRHGVGIDNVDLKAATERGIAVVFTPSALTMVHAVAEQTVQLMLALGRHAVAADEIVRAGRWKDRSSLMGVEFYGKTLGVIGLGAIGKKVASICQKGLGMKVVAYDPFVKEPPAEFEATMVGSLTDVLKQADVLTLHMPSTPETANLIGAKEIAAMKPTALLVNAARGGIVDSAALAEALNRGHLFGAALDVFTEEPPAANDPIMSAPRTLFSPHVASMTTGSMARMAELVSRQVVQALHGERPAHVANPEVYSAARGL